MEKINTNDLVRKVGIRCIQWLSSKNRRHIIDRNCPGERLNLTLTAFRVYLEGLLYYLTRKIGHDNEQLLGSYIVSSKEGKNYVTIKKSKSRIPRSISSYVKWVDWDISLAEDKLSITSTRVTRHIVVDYSLSYHSRRRRASRLTKGLSVYLKCALSQVLLQSLFGIGQAIDLRSKPLPATDLRCRVGNYILLYDHLAKEWRLWKKT